MPSIPGYVADRIRRPYPKRGHVVPGSTPVVSFGDHSRARIASLGINPSRLEFQDAAGHLLQPEARRLADLPMLEAQTTTELSDHSVAVVVDWCNTYFTRHPYTKWFDKLNTLVRAAGGDFYDGTACHLDLVQWATDPVWGSFPRGDERIQDELLSDDALFLRRQLSAPNIELVLLNGSKVVNQVQKLGIVMLQDVGHTPVGKRGKVSRLLEGTGADGTRFVGWTLNSSHSQTTLDNRERLAEWLKRNLR